MEREEKITLIFNIILTIICLALIALFSFDIVLAQTSDFDSAAIEELNSNIDNSQEAFYSVNGKYVYVAPQFNADSKTTFFVDEYIDSKGNVGYQKTFVDLNGNKKSFGVGYLSAVLSINPTIIYSKSTSTHEKL